MDSHCLLRCHGILIANAVQDICVFCKGALEPARYTQLQAPIGPEHALQPNRLACKKAVPASLVDDAMERLIGLAIVISAAFLCGLHTCLLRFAPLIELNG